MVGRNYPWDEFSSSIKLAVFTCTFSKVLYISFPLVHMYIENINTLSLKCKSVGGYIHDSALASSSCKYDIVYVCTHNPLRYLHEAVVILFPPPLQGIC